MFSKELIELIYKSKMLNSNAIKYILAIFLTIILALLLFLTIDVFFGEYIFLKNILNYENIGKITSILLGFFGVIFILFIIAMAVNGKELIEKNKKELLEKVKSIIEENELTKYFDKFSSSRSSLGYKTISSPDKLGKNIRINITLIEDDDDFGRLSLYINKEDYEKLNKKIKNKFKREEGNGWSDYSYPYIEKFDGDCKTLEKQLLEIVKIFKD